MAKKSSPEEELLPESLLNRAGYAFLGRQHTADAIAAAQKSLALLEHEMDLEEERKARFQRALVEKIERLEKTASDRP